MKLEHSAGYVGMSALIVYLLALLAGQGMEVACLLTWIYGALVFKNCSRSTKKLALALGGIGLLMLLVSIPMSLPSRAPDVFGINQQIISLFFAVTFLSLTTHKFRQKTAGKPHLASTLANLNLLGGLISLPMPYIVGDAMYKRHGSLSKAQTIAVTRSFCAAAYWSPFFISAGVAATYAPLMQPAIVFGFGALIALFGLTYTYFECQRHDLSEFDGFATSPVNLAVPALLITGIVICNLTSPPLSIIQQVTLAAPIVSLALNAGADLPQKILNHARTTLPGACNQVVLFLAAGIFAVGCSTVVEALPGMDSPGGFNPNFRNIGVVLGLMILVTYAGIHPLISIAIVASLLVPTGIDHTVLAMVFLAGWAIGAGAAAISGTSVAFIARWQIRPTDIMRWNGLYTILMWLLSTVVIVLIANSI